MLPEATFAEAARWRELVLPRPSSARLWPGLVTGAEFVVPEPLGSRLRATSRLANAIFGPHGSLPHRDVVLPRALPRYG